MFTSFDENAFRKAIDEKDYTSLKINTVSSMLNDPTFARGETDKILKILHEEVPGIFENYVELDYEEHLEPSAWDKRYFTKLTYWFQENFAESRVEYIKEVGRAVHQDTAQKYSQSISVNQRRAQPKPKPPKPPKQKRRGHVENPPQAPAAKGNKFPTLKVIAAVAVLVLLLVLVVVLLIRRLTQSPELI